MTAHKHAEMIKEKADNMDLAVFFKSNDSVKWIKIYCSNANGLPAFYEDGEYFLCRQKHEKECLHWLNGGEIEVFDEYSGEWLEAVTKEDFREWRSVHFLMREFYQVRIKPRKEKRWIAVKDGKAMSNYLFESENEARVICGRAGHDAQFIQIEVEV